MRTLTSAARLRRALCRRSGPTLLVFALAAAAAAVGVRPAGAAVDRNIYRSADYELEVAFPTDWAVAEQASYPGLLVVAIDSQNATRPSGGRRPQPGKMTLAVEHLRDGESLRDCLERNRTALASVGFEIKTKGTSSVPPTRHPTGAEWFQAVAPGGKQLVRQAYRSFGGDDMVFVLTLVAPRESLQSYVRAFDDTLRGMQRTIKAPEVEEADEADVESDETEPSGDVP
jgi:hypothetical protein